VSQPGILNRVHKIAVLCIFIRLVIRTERTARKLSVVSGVVILMMIVGTLSLTTFHNWASDSDGVLVNLVSDLSFCGQHVFVVVDSLIFLIRIDSRSQRLIPSLMRFLLVVGAFRYVALLVVISGVAVLLLVVIDIVTTG